MAAQYYYQVSTLPMLRLGEPARLSLEAFTGFCSRQLPAAVATALERLGLEPDGQPCCEVERRWQVWETYARNCLVRLRALRLGLDAAHFVRPVADAFPVDRRRLEEVLSDPDPLQRERELDRLRWQRLDDLAVGHEFDLEALVLYKLRLLLVSKWGVRTAAAGRRLHERLVATGVEQAVARRTSAGQGPGT